MTFGSLFAGIGGMDLGLERAGMVCKWQVEIDPFCRQVLAKHWPEVPKYEDVRTVGAELESVDLIAGGFPCQDVSVAGKKAGIEGERSGLWSEYARIVGQLRPRYVLVENVPGLLERGMGRVLGDLAALGYDAQWNVLPAAGVGLPHVRERLFIVAYSQCEGLERDVQPNLDSYAFGAKIRRKRLSKRDTVRIRNGVPNWVDRIRGCGNAVCPPVAEWIGRRIMEAAK